MARGFSTLIQFGWTQYVLLFVPGLLSVYYGNKDLYFLYNNVKAIMDAFPSLNVNSHSEHVGNTKK